eukprot:CAMPEP_0185256544 /NCGR_PEP_ID=MMETSP1359-20130426/5645_1 /TAXON_ID=552665 /ORGANISM="Bigelowiella longifila, Strain CCMP242" /LENGTH=275 /DNA_ID=CAMNT_0027841173 /DNA_START=139 /DNA_END=966 /DNA_ORIENTATION=+
MSKSSPTKPQSPSGVEQNSKRGILKGHQKPAKEKKVHFGPVKIKVVEALRWEALRGNIREPSGPDPDYCTIGICRQRRLSLLLDKIQARFMLRRWRDKAAVATAASNTTRTGSDTDTTAYTTDSEMLTFCTFVPKGFDLVDVCDEAPWGFDEEEKDNEEGEREEDNEEERAGKAREKRGEGSAEAEIVFESERVGDETDEGGNSLNPSDDTLDSHSDRKSSRYFRMSNDGNSERNQTGIEKKIINNLINRNNNDEVRTYTTTKILSGTEVAAIQA